MTCASRRVGAVRGIARPAVRTGWVNVGLCGTGPSTNVSGDRARRMLAAGNVTWATTVISFDPAVPTVGPDELEVPSLASFV